MAYYFKDLLKEDEEHVEQRRTHVLLEQLENEEQEQVEEPTELEIEEAITELKNNKSAVDNGIPA